MNELPVLAHFGVLLIRPGMLVALVPNFGGMYVPGPTKIGITVLIAIGLLPSVAAPAVPNDLALTGLVARELAIGLALGLALKALVSGAEFAGHLSGYQIGFSYAATIDPSNGVRSSMLSSLFGLVAVLTLFGVNGHHAILRALAASYNGLPMGAGAVNESLLDGVRQTLALVFTTGARLAAPIIVVLVVVEVAIGFVSRAAPALSFMVIGYPIRVVVGLFVLGLVVAAVPGAISGLVEPTIRLALGVASAFR